jgi:hypothetical protein
MTKPRGTIGPVLPTTAKGHCGFVTSWAVHMCGAPATIHYLYANPVHNKFACADHADRVAVVFPPVDRHPTSSECVHPGSEWRTSGARAGFCFVPTEDVELVTESQEVGAR